MPRKRYTSEPIILQPREATLLRQAQGPSVLVLREGSRRRTMSELGPHVAVTGFTVALCGIVFIPGPYRRRICPGRAAIDPCCGPAYHEIFLLTNRRGGATYSSFAL
jgi:hypothetical protein